MRKEKTKITYEAVFEEQPDGGFTVTIPTLPGCISEGDTFELAKKNILEAATAYLESLAMDNKKTPAKSGSIFVGSIAIPIPFVA